MAATAGAGAGRRVGFTEASELLLPVTLVFAAATVLAATPADEPVAERLLSAAVGSDLSCEAYRRTLYQPYEVHVQRNSAAVITTTTTQIAQTVAALNALLQMLTLLVAASLLTGLLVINARWLWLLLPCLVVLTEYWRSRRGGSYVVTAKKSLLLPNSKLNAAEGLGAIRDVLLEGSQTTYLQIYRQADRPQRQLQAKNNLGVSAGNRGLHGGDCPARWVACRSEAAALP